MKDLRLVYVVQITQGKSTARSLWFYKKEAKSYVKYAHKEWVKAWVEFPKLKTVEYHAEIIKFVPLAIEAEPLNLRRCNNDQ